MLLRKWTPLFDPEQERLEAGPLCVHLPGLPLQLWSEDIFRHIGNALGTYLENEKSYLTTRKMTYAKVLVHLDTTDGLRSSLLSNGGISHGGRHWIMKELPLDVEDVIT